MASNGAGNGSQLPLFIRGQRTGFSETAPDDDAVYPGRHLRAQILFKHGKVQTVIGPEWSDDRGEYSLP